MNVENKYFLMSFRFNKTQPEDFDLSPTLENDVFTSNIDQSLWKRTDLYDFGWGREIGYYRLPLLSFNELWNLLKNSKDNDNKYGSAALIEIYYYDELMKKIKELTDKNEEIATYSDLINIFSVNKLNKIKLILKEHNLLSEENFKDWKFIYEILCKCE